MWQSIADIHGIPWRAVATSAIAVVLLGVALIAVLPAPRVSASLDLPLLVRRVECQQSEQPDRRLGLAAGPRGEPSGSHRRRRLPRVRQVPRHRGTDHTRQPGGDASRASRPNFWVGETFDEWNGQSWLQAANPAKGPAVPELPPGSPFTIAPTADEAGAQVGGPLDVQTFYLAQSGPNLVFHADEAERVYIESRTLLLPGDGTIVSSTSMGAGTIYTVVSDDSEATGRRAAAGHPS